MCPDPTTRTIPAILLFGLIGAAAPTVSAQVPEAVTTLPVAERTLPENRILTHREQAPLVRDRIERRFDKLLPGLMSSLIGVSSNSATRGIKSGSIAPTR